MNEMQCRPLQKTHCCLFCLQYRHRRHFVFSCPDRTVKNYPHRFGKCQSNPNHLHLTPNPLLVLLILNKPGFLLTQQVLWVTLKYWAQICCKHNVGWSHRFPLDIPIAKRCTEESMPTLNLHSLLQAGSWNRVLFQIDNPSRVFSADELQFPSWKGRFCVWLHPLWWGPAHTAPHQHFPGGASKTTSPTRQRFSPFPFRRNTKKGKSGLWEWVY